MNRMKHLVTAVTAVIVVVTGLSTGAALLRHRAAAGQGGEAGGHNHAAHTDGMKMDEKGMEMGEKKTAGHPAGHGGEDKDQPAGQADAHGGAGDHSSGAHAEGMKMDGRGMEMGEKGMKMDEKGMKMQGHAMPSTAPSAAEMLEPLLSASRPAATAPADIQYTCTMHPEVISDKPGKCPKCGMKLVQKKG